MGYNRLLVSDKVIRSVLENKFSEFRKQIVFSLCSSWFGDHSPCWKRIITLFQSSAASRCILLPLERYGRLKKCAQKSSCNTFSICISLKYSLQILRHKNLLKRHIFYQIFLDPQLQPLGSLSLNYPIQS